jgi:hypothetical protein
MGVTEGLGPAWQYRARVERGVGDVGGMQWTTVVDGWPCAIRYLTYEDRVRLGMPEATHALTGPLWPRRAIQPGDRVAALVDRSGQDWVRPGKAWTVVGRHGYPNDVDRHQTVYVREEV